MKISKFFCLIYTTAILSSTIIDNQKDLNIADSRDLNNYPNMNNTQYTNIYDIFQSHPLSHSMYGMGYSNLMMNPLFNPLMMNPYMMGYGMNSILTGMMGGMMPSYMGMGLSPYMNQGMMPFMGYPGANYYGHSIKITKKKVIKKKAQKKKEIVEDKEDQPEKEDKEETTDGQDETKL